MARGNNSILFHRAYTGSACCSPTRAAVLTGRAPQRSCIDSADGAGQAPAWAKPAHKQLPWGQFTVLAGQRRQGEWYGNILHGEMAPRRLLAVRSGGVFLISASPS
jgi:hypothetical protein